MPKNQKRPNGTGSVYWNSAKKRYVGAAVGKDGTRRYIYGPKGDRSPTARLAVTERLGPLMKRRLSADSRRSVGEFIAKVIENADLRNNTRANYRWALKTYIEPYPLARLKLENVERVTIRDHLASLQPPIPKVLKNGQQRPTATAVGADTKRRVRALLHRVFEEAVDLEILDRNPVDRVPAPAPKRKRMAVWEPNEVLIFLKEAQKTRLYAMYLLALTTTMGPAELWGLQKDDLHLKGGYLWVTSNLEDVNGRVQLGATKNENRRRRIDLPAITVEALKEHLKANIGRGPLVFTSPEGQPLRRQNFYRREWRPLLDRVAAIAEKAAREQGEHEYRFPRIRPYDLRHTSNALMGFMGVSIDLAKARMGHSSIRTTVDTYGHIYGSQQQEVAAKFDALLASLSK